MLINTIFLKKKKIMGIIDEINRNQSQVNQVFKTYKSIFNGAFNLTF